jgi:hypothetical protein
MQSGEKQLAGKFRGLARTFGGLGRRAQATSAEDVAFDYYQAAQRAGTLLREACRSGLLPEIPGLAKLVARKIDEARLFKQFHGFEVNAAVLLSGCCETKPDSAAVTCGLLPQLLPGHPAFRPRSYRGKTPEQEALLTELRRAREACRWLADQIAGSDREAPPGSKRRPVKKATRRVPAPVAKTGRKYRTKTSARK